MPSLLLKFFDFANIISSSLSNFKSYDALLAENLLRLGKKIDSKKKFLNFHRSLGNTNIGNPPGIIFDERKITFDDCWSVEELFFLKDKIRKNFNILEIGPGYGRTAQAIINSFDIRSYFMIDFKLTLKLTKKYLKKVLRKENLFKLFFYS